MAERSDRQLLEALLASSERIEAVIGKLAEISCRQNDATEELARRRKMGAAREAKRRAALRQPDATLAKLPKSLTSTLRQNGVTGDYRGKVVSSSSQEKKEQTPKPLVASDGVTAKDQVWGFWKLHLGKASHARFDKKRQRAVEARLRDGYTVDQLCEAIQGCKLDPFSMGKNDRNQRFDDLSLICRDAAHVDKFIALAPKAAASNGAPRLAPWEQHAKEDEEVLVRHGIGKAS